MRKPQHSKTSVPGKLFLWGEYAVLEGVPATVWCTQERACITWTPIQPQDGHVPPKMFCVDTLGFQNKNHTLVWDGADWKSEDPFTAQDLQAVLSILKRFEIDPQGWKLQIDTSGFYHESRKLGLGSSAAVVCGLTHSILSHVESPSIAMLQNLHRDIQGGVGSGADVAAMMTGGLVRVQGSIATKASLTEHQDSICVGRIDTGTSASTTKLAQGYLMQPASGTLRLAFTETAIAFDEMLQNSRWSSLFDLCQRHCVNLDSLSREVGIDYLGPIHRQWWQKSQLYGFGYKPSGAGLGDFGLVFCEPQAKAKLEGLANDNHSSIQWLDFGREATGVKRTFWGDA